MKELMINGVIMCGLGYFIRGALKSRISMSVKLCSLAIAGIIFFMAGTNSLKITKNLNSSFEQKLNNKIDEILNMGF